MDSFFARDIQRLFPLRDPQKFHAFFEFVLKQSGGLLEVTRAAGMLGVRRSTVERHLRALEVTGAATSLRPFHGGGRKGSGGLRLRPARLACLCSGSAVERGARFLKAPLSAGLGARRSRNGGGRTVVSLVSGDTVR
ncbi:MAG: hypothetical protein HYZ53_21700 [Planctomycetes bacterium]|nr:hypothetical protein [Planctomycetota bacterium]